MGRADFWPRYLFEDDPDLDEREDEEEEEEDDEREDDEGTHGGGAPEDGEAAAPQYRAEFGLPGDHGLVLELDLDDEYHSLGLLVPGGEEPVELGWDDQAHFHPHALRWSELELLARAFALHDPELRHPGPVLGLLARFVVLGDEDDVDRMAPMVDAAFTLLRPDGGTGARRPETRDWYELRNLSGTGLRWTGARPGPAASTGPAGAAAPTPGAGATGSGGRGAAPAAAVAAVEQRAADPLHVRRPLYSLRGPGSAFPFAGLAALLARAEAELTEAAADPALAGAGVRSALDRCTAPDGAAHLGPLAEALEAAGFARPALLRAVAEPTGRAEACWAVEVLAGLPQGELVKRWFGSSGLAEARSWELTLVLPARGRRAGAVAADLSAALRRTALGRAEHGGSTSVRSPQGGYVHGSDSLDVLLHDDLPAGVAVVADVLRRHDALDSAVLRYSTAPYDRVPLG